MAHFTPTELRIIQCLSDGMAHTRKELKDNCIDDELACDAALRVAICKLRNKLKSRGQTIICEMGKSRILYYRHVRLLNSPIE